MKNAPIPYVLRSIVASIWEAMAQGNTSAMKQCDHEASPHPKSPVSHAGTLDAGARAADAERDVRLRRPSYASFLSIWIAYATFESIVTGLVCAVLCVTWKQRGGKRANVFRATAADWKASNSTDKRAQSQDAAWRNTQLQRAITALEGDSAAKGGTMAGFWAPFVTK